MSTIYLVYLIGYLLFLSVYAQEDTSQNTTVATTPISTATEAPTSSDIGSLGTASTTTNSPITDSESLKDSETPNPFETTSVNPSTDQIDSTVQNKNCKPNCAICQEKDSCDLCATGFGFNSEFECSKCQIHCLECGFIDSCSQCEPNWTLSLNNQCGLATNCPENCKVCDGNSNCLQCNVGSRQQNGQCTACIKGCDQCGDGETCQICSSDFDLVGSKCLLQPVDVSCTENCKGCENGICLECNAGWWMDTNHCTTCSDPCKTCLDDTLCTSCIDGLQLNDQSQCNSITSPSTGMDDSNDDTVLLQEIMNINSSNESMMSPNEIDLNKTHVMGKIYIQ